MLVSDGVRAQGSCDGWPGCAYKLIKEEFRKPRLADDAFSSFGIGSIAKMIDLHCRNHSLPFDKPDILSMTAFYAVLDEPICFKYSNNFAEFYRAQSTYAGHTG